MKDDPPLRVSSLALSRVSAESSFILPPSSFAAEFMAHTGQDLRGFPRSSQGR